MHLICAKRKMMSISTFYVALFAFSMLPVCRKIFTFHVLVFNCLWDQQLDVDQKYPCFSTRTLRGVVSLRYNDFNFWNCMFFCCTDFYWENSWAKIKPIWWPFFSEHDSLQTARAKVFWIFHKISLVFCLKIGAVIQRLWQP